MASYTADQLREGTPIEALTSGTTYTFTLTNPTNVGTAYFTVDTVSNYSGSYAGQPTNAVGTYTSFGGGIIGQGDSLVVESDYKSSVIIGNSGTAQYSFTPTSNIAVGSSLLRATGDVALTIS